MNLLFENTVPLSSAVKAAALDCGEDFTKVEATFSHWAVRILKDVNRKLLRMGGIRATIPVNANLKTATLPLGMIRVTFVGVIDDCGEKHSLLQNSNLVGYVEEIQCVEKCTECGQAEDICENLAVTEEFTTEVLTDSTGTYTYTNTTTKILEGDKYYLIKKRWVLNIDKNLVQEIVTKEFITEFDMLRCGCPANTDDNLDKIKEHCSDCYSTCYSPCRKGVDVGYRVIDDTIHLESNYYKKIYVEGEGVLVKKEGTYHVPEVAFEMIVAGIKHRRTWNKNHIQKYIKDMDKADFVEKYKDCQKILGRIALTTITDIFGIGSNTHSSGVPLGGAIISKKQRKVIYSAVATALASSDSAKSYLYTGLGTEGNVLDILQLAGKGVILLVKGDKILFPTTDIVPQPNNYRRSGSEFIFGTDIEPTQTIQIIYT